MSQGSTFPASGPGSGAYPPAPPSGPAPGAYPPPTPQVAYVVKQRTKWYALRTIAVILKVFAWITAGFGAISIIFALIEGSQFGNFGLFGALIFGVGDAIGAAFAFMVMYAYSEFILVLIAIEENTRKI